MSKRVKNCRPSTYARVNGSPAKTAYYPRGIAHEGGRARHPGKPERDRTWTPEMQEARDKERAETLLENTTKEV